MRHRQFSLVLLLAMLNAIWPGGGQDESVPIVVHRADPGTAVIMVGVAVALYGAALALRRPPKSTISIDNTPTALAGRGFRAPILIGARFVGNSLIFAQNRTTRQEAVSGVSGGKGGGRRSSQQTQTVYYEEGISHLGTGPIDRLNYILQGGDVLWSGPIDRFSTPSGTEITCSDGSTFQIWWGEHDQPIDTWASDPTRLQVASRWPYHARISWKPKRLGTSRTWPDLRFSIEQRGPASGLSDSVSYFQATDEEADNEGPNPAHAIYQLLTAPHPHGAGIPPDWIDFGTLESLGVLMQSEHMPCSIVANAAEGTESVQDILSDMQECFGFVTPEVGGKIVFVPVRYVDPLDVPEFTGQMITAPNPEREFVQGASYSDKVQYVIRDRTQRFTRTPIDLADDAEASRYSRRVAVDKELTCIVDIVTARKCATRREMEQFASGSKYTFTMNYTARAMSPGMAFRVEGLPQMRVGTIRARYDSQLVEVVAAVDHYSLVSSSWDPGAGVVGGSSSSPESDLYVFPFEIPSQLIGDVVALGCARIRSNAATGSAVVWISLDGTTYRQIGTQSGWGAGGLLLSEISENSLTVVENGPVIRALGPDVASSVQDLTSDVSGWVSGRQLALINGEIMFLRNVTAVVGGWRLDGLIRGRAGTVASEHGAGSRVFIVSSSTIQALTSPELIPGRTIFVKVQPVGVALESCVAVPFTVRGRALSPLPADMLGHARASGDQHSIASVGTSSGYFEISGERPAVVWTGGLVLVAGNSGSGVDGVYRVRAVTVTGGNTRVYCVGGIPAAATASGTIESASIVPVYSSGTDIVPAWSYRVGDVSGATAGDQGFGVAVPLGEDGMVERPAPEGRFVVEVLDSAGVVRRSWSVNTSTPSPWIASGRWESPIVYTSSERSADFGVSDPSVLVFRVRCVSGAYSSDARDFTLYLEA